MNRTEELDKILEKISKLDEKDMEKQVKELMSDLENLPVSNFMFLMRIAAEVMKKYQIK